MLRSLMLTFGFTASLFSADFAAIVSNVIDGDTIDVIDANRNVTRVRIADIDAPESDQPGGREATATLSDLLLNSVVTIRPNGQEDRGRVVASVLDRENRPAGAFMVFTGHAWAWKHTRDDMLRDFEAQARANQRGLWAERNPIAPWDWRANDRPQQQAQQQGPRTLQQIAAVGDWAAVTVVATDGTFLGHLGSDTDRGSVFNEYGDHSKYSPKSMLNEYGQYGGAYGLMSPSNPYCLNPPLLCIDGVPVAHVTNNEYLAKPGAKLPLATVLQLPRVVRP